MTDNEKDAQRVGVALAERRIANPYKAWKLEPRVPWGKLMTPKEK